jgi:DNA-binding SARP family transcriptional activator
VSGRASLAVRVLGPVEADVDGAPADLGSPKQRGLLALLAIEPGRVVSAERLIGELWGDDAADSALSTLQVYVSRLRRALGPDQAAGDPVVVRRAPGYVLDVRPEAVDTQAFDRLLTAATEKADLAPREAMRLVDEALALVRGPVLGDVVDRLGDVARTEAQRLEERVLSARELRLELLLASGEAAAAATAAAALAAELPLRESVHAILVLALYRSGRQAEALACYDQVRTRLADELGVDPGPELRHLHAQVLRHDPALAAPEPAPEPRRAAPDTPPVAVRREQPPLIGRDAELEQLLAAAADARAGHGSLAAVIGEAGIGKTRLVRELADRCAADGMLVAWGATPEEHTGAPLAPWHRILAALPDSPSRRDLRARDGGPAEWAAEIVAAAAAQPLLVVVEDVSWADPASLAVLGALAPECADRGILLLVTRRPDPSPEWTEVAGRLARLPHLRLELDTLRDDAATAVISSRLLRPRSPETCAAVAARADGNPLFLVELARLLDQAPEDVTEPDVDVPGSVRDLMLARVQQLSPDARSLLDVAAVAGREAPLSVVATVVGLSPAAFDDALDETTAAGVLVEVGDSHPLVRFPHALLRDAVYAELRPRHRARWHGEIARALVSSQVQDPERLAGHLLESVDSVGPEAVLPALLEAADRAGGWWLDQARTVAAQVPAGPDADRARMAVLRRDAARAAIAHGWSSAEAGAPVEALVALARRLPPEQEAVDLLFQRTIALLGAGELDRIETEMEPLLRSDAAGHEGELLARLALGLVASCRNRPETTHRHLTRVIDLAADGLAHGPSWADVGITAQGALAHALLHLRQPERSAALAADTLTRAAALPAVEALSAELTIALLAASRGDHESAARYADDARVRGRERGLDVVVVLAEVVLGWAEVRRTRIPADPAARTDALAALRSARQHWTAYGVVVLDVVVATLTAEAELECGHPAQALEQADAVRPGAADLSWAARLADVRLRAARASGAAVEQAL